MKFNKIFIFIIVLSSLSLSQFTEVNVKIDYTNINDNELFMFENFDREIQSFFTNNYFYDEPDELDIRIDLNVIIENINYIGSEKIITSQILFTNKKDQHFFSKSFDFTYQKNQALYKSDIFHPLASLLSCYAYLHVANELDTYEYLGGNKYFMKAQNIAAEGKSSMYQKNWSSRLKKIRREMENHTFRNLKFNFFSIYDILEYGENNDRLQEYMDEMYELFIEYDSYYGYSKPLSTFLNAYNAELVDMATNLKFVKIIDYLILYDNSNELIYKRYFNE